MIKLKGGYSAVIDGQDVMLKGIHKFPDEIKKELIEKKFAEEVLEADITPRELTKVKTIFLVDGKLTEIEPVQVAEEDSTDADDSTNADGEINQEILMAMTVEKIKALAQEKGIELKATKKEDLVKEFLENLGA